MILNRFLILSVLLVLFSSSILYVSTTQIQQESPIVTDTENFVPSVESFENNELIKPYDNSNNTEIEEPQKQNDEPENIEPQTPIIINEKTNNPDSIINSETEEELNQPVPLNNSPINVDINSTITTNNPLIIPIIPQIPNFPPLEIPNDSHTLHTEGRWIKDEWGRTVFLRGVNKPSLEWDMNTAFWNESDWDTIKSWGCNVVRIPFTKSWWDNNEPTEDGMFYREKIGQAIKWGEEREIYTILDMHWWTRKEKQLPMPPDLTEWFKTWIEIANNYKSNPFVLFDIWNEPHDISSSEWWNAAQQCVTDIRSTGAQNIILVSVQEWTHDATIIQTLGPIQGSNIAYSYHQYPDEFSNSDNVQGIKDQLTKLGWKYILDNNIAPIIIGEFGAYPDKTEEINFINALTRIANGQENNDLTDWTMSYLAWWFVPYPDQHALIHKDWKTPTNAGNAIIKAINAHKD